RQAGEHGGTDRRTPRLAEQEGRLRVHVDEYLFDRHLDRAVGCEHFLQSVKDGFQPRREVPFAGAHAAAGYVPESTAPRLDHAEARESQAGVDPEDLQSITAVV